MSSRKELVDLIKAASAMPGSQGLTLLLQVLEALKAEPQPRVNALLIRGLGRLSARGVLGAAEALHEARAIQ